jgi:predicted nucleic acid-binding protein
VKCALDAGVDLQAMRSDSGRAAFERRFLPLLFCTSVSGVVAEELYAGAMDDFAIRLVDRYIGALREVGRVITPTFDDWTAAGKLIARITRNERGLKSKAQLLVNDVLIALCAQHLGATLFTFNRDDFELIRRYRPFTLEVLKL